MSGNGTLTTPWDLATALAAMGLNSGDFLNLLTGTYAGDFSATVTGEAGSLIEIQPYDGAVKINGSVYFSSPYLQLSNVEICDLDFTDRENNIPIHDGVRAENSASGIKVVNNIIHDCRQGILCPSIASSLMEFYGNLIYYNGWSDVDRGHGHGLYTSNSSAYLKITDCIIHSQFGYGLHCWVEGGDGSDRLKNIQVEGCTFFDNGILYSTNYGDLIGGSGVGATVRTSYMKNCYLKDNLNIGWLTAGSIGFILQNCVIVGNLTMLYYGDAPTITGNKIYGTVTITNGDTSEVVDHTTVFPDNEYYASGMPDAVYLRANTYDATRANLTIFNGSSANTVEVDVSAIYSNGTTVQARNVQDYFTDIQSLTVTAGKITVNMQAANRTVATPQGWTAPAKTFPTFGCFVLSA